MSSSLYAHRRAEAKVAEAVRKEMVRAYTVGERVYGVTDDCAVFLLNVKEVYGR